ncbi:AMP-binding protein [Brevibacterium atlanticum]|uniref:AMP-binding protein n=1 Tax=Brevibacterium atlanticum TaxID=2697563 RepID=UPI0014200F8F|nr:AMP-binding protein [Brevibacterium atlanticum]
MNQTSPDQRPRCRTNLDETVHNVLSRAADRYPDKTAISFIGAAAYTNAELLHLSRCLAEGFRRAGVGFGDRVALLISNRIEFVSTYFALSMLGAVSVPLNTSLKGDVLTHMLSTVAPCRLVIEDEFFNEAIPAVEQSESVIGMWHIPGVGSDESKRTPAFEELVAETPLQDMAETDGSTLHSILFTSGTTGKSKGVMWSHRMALGAADNSTWVMGYTDDDVIYTCLPLFHINALFTAFIAGLKEGAETVVSRRFSARRFWSEFAETRATKTNMLGAMGAVLWKNRPSPHESRHQLQLAMVVPFPKSNYVEFESRFGIEITELYGSTDTGIPIGIPHTTRRSGSCGSTAPGWEVQIVDALDNPVPPRVPGELVTRPLTPFIGQLGYWREPEKTWDAHRNCWFHTGDQAFQDEEGFFYFLDRTKDAMRVSGENVSSFEVEQVIVSHNKVAEVAVVAIASDLGEDDILAYVVVEPDETVSAEEIEDFSQTRLPYFAVPRYIHIVKELPKTSTQKVKKADLRAHGVPTGAYDGGQRRRNRSRSSD